HLLLTKEAMPSRFPPAYSHPPGPGIRTRVGNGIMPYTIQRRLTLILTVTCTLLGTAGGSGLYFTVRSGLLTSFDGMLKARAEGLAALIKESKKSKSNEDSSRPALPDFTGIRWPSCFQIWSSSGETIERSQSLGTNDLPRLAGPIDAPQFW